MWTEAGSAPEPVPLPDTAAPLDVPRPLIAHGCWYPSADPDGREVAFICDRTGVPQLWVAPVDGEQARLLDADPDPVVEVSWSPDGRWIAYTTAPGGGELTRVLCVRPDGTMRRLLAGGEPGASAHLGCWAPDGSAVAVTVTEPAPVGPPRVETDGTTATTDTPVAAHTGDWTGRGGRAFLMGGTPLTSHPPEERGSAVRPAHDGAPSGEPGQRTLAAYLVDPAGGAASVLLASEAGAPTLRVCALSQDGELALVRRGPRGHREALVVRLRDRTVTGSLRVADGDPWIGGFSPDGCTLWLRSDAEGEFAELVAVRLGPRGQWRGRRVVAARAGCDLELLTLDRAGRSALLAWNVRGVSELEVTTLHPSTPARESTSPATGGPPPAAGGPPPAADGTPPATGGPPPATGGPPPATGGPPPAAGGTPPATGGRPPAADGIPPFPGGPPPVTGGIPPAPGGATLPGATDLRAATGPLGLRVFPGLPKPSEPRDLSALSRLPAAGPARAFALPHEVVTRVAPTLDPYGPVVALSGSPRRPGVWWLHEGVALRTPWSARDEDAVPGGRPPVRPVPLRPVARDGLPLGGWYYRAAGRSPGEPAPCVLHLHGGPEEQERPVLNPLYHELLGRGVDVFAPDIRGSSGYGRSFVDADLGEGRFAALDDVADCAAHVVVEGWADPRRLAVMGRSYGGYLTMASLVRHPELFRTGVAVCGMSDLNTFFAGTEPWLAESAAHKYGHPERDRELLRALSPMSRIDALRVPVLAVHGEHDTNVPVGESEQFVRAARERGLDAELLLLRQEGHEFRRADNRRLFRRTAADWIERHLTG
ncbi:S9 family peptidase [Streptomyces sp. NPDC051452]|uniref:S9 family peptidase n=1 Tax=Streptomyces sp. NPDC051452 TaxID=3365654 RepID=UPI00379172BB